MQYHSRASRRLAAIRLAEPSERSHREATSSPAPLPEKIVQLIATKTFTLVFYC